MFLPDKLFEKALYWGPLFVGVISLVLGTVVLQRGHTTTKQSSLAISNAEHQSADGEFNARANPIAKNPVVTELARDMAPDVAHGQKKNLKAQKHSFDKLLATVLAQRGRVAGETGAEISPGIAQNGDRVFALKRDHLAGLMGTRLAHNGWVGYKGLEQVIQRGSTRFLLIAADDWGGQIGKLGAQMEAGLNPGIQLGTRGPVSAFIAQLAAPLGSEAKIVRKGALFGAGAGETFKLAYLSRTFGARLGARGGISQQRLRARGNFSGQKYNVKLAGAQIGKAPFALKEGMKILSDLANGLLLEHHSQRYGQSIGGSSMGALVAGRIYFDTAAERFREMAKAREALRAETLALLANKKELAGLRGIERCSRAFHTVLQSVRDAKIVPLKKQLKPLFQVDKKLPGKWIFRMAQPRAKSKCLRYKVYYSGRKKCVKWRKRTQRFTARFLSDEEKQFILKAQKIIYSKGRTLALKPRSSNHWVINRITTDLNSYSRQPLNPAICTGAIRMVDYFEGNLGRVKKLVVETKRLFDQSRFLLEARRQHLEALISNAAREARYRIENNLVTVSDAVGDTLNERADDLPVKRPVAVPISLTKISTKDLYGALFELSKTLFGADMAYVLDVRGDFIEALGVVRKTYREHGVKVPHNQETLRAVEGLFGLLEASYYVQLYQKRLLPLEEHLFGSLSAIRIGHEQVCACQP